jgi:hypothetical protein
MMHLGLALGAFFFFAPSAILLAARPADFGQQWVRSHPFTLMGLQQSHLTLDINEHRGANMSSLLVWWNDGNGKPIAQIASNGNMPWHALIVDGEGDERDRITNYASVGNSVGWMMGDEVDGSMMPFFNELGNWVKDNRPNDLVYTNALPTYAGFPDYSAYLEQIVDTMHPDVLMYDHYPFVENLMRHDYFQNMMLVRNKALEHNLPYWAFMQSSALAAYRLPSRSDARMQVFTHLAAGYTGIAYFTFDNEPIYQYAAILDTAGNPTSLYPIVADLNKEAANLGKALRFMRSDDVKYIPGRHTEGSSIVKNEVAFGMQEWSAATDSDDHIIGMAINSVSVGSDRFDGLIGFFTDDLGRDAFMVTNVYHGPSVPANSQFSITILFDSSVTSLLRIDRLTGQQVVVPLDAAHRLVLTLPAGTGELFKYNDGDFLLAPVPEPGTIGLPLFAIGFISCARRQRPKR